MCSAESAWLAKLMSITLDGALRRGEVDEAALAEHRDPMAVLERVLVDELAHGALLGILV